MCVLAAQSCLTLCDHMDCSPPGSSVHRILQARILEWFAISSFRMDYYSAIKRNEVTNTSYSSVKMQKDHAEWKKPDTKGCVISFV